MWCLLLLTIWRSLFFSGTRQGDAVRPAPPLQPSALLESCRMNKKKNRANAPKLLEQSRCWSPPSGTIPHTCTTFLPAVLFWHSGSEWWHVGMQLVLLSSMLAKGSLNDYYYYCYDTVVVSTPLFKSLGWLTHLCSALCGQFHEIMILNALWLLNAHESVKMWLKGMGTFLFLTFSASNLLLRDFKCAKFCVNALKLGCKVPTMWTLVLCWLSCGLTHN